MNYSKKTAIIVGVLSIIGMAAGVLSVVSVIDAPDYLIKISANESRILSGAFFQFIIIPVYIGISLLLFPILKKHNEGLALGFVGFRIIAGVFNLIGVILLPLFLILSQEFVKAGTPDSSYFHALGGLLRTGRDLTNHVGMVPASCIGALLYYSILFQTKLVPRWLSGWGLLGAALAISASLLFLLNVLDVVTASYITIPLALQEFILAIWLIVKGFNSAVVNSKPLLTGNREQVSVYS